MPKVSVIIPNYNHGRFLEQRIDSVLNQTFQDFEVILLDDRSTDNSQEIFAKYVNHPRLSHLIVNDINSNSTFKQWNKGIDLAAGEYIWIAESDDYAAPEFLEELVPVLERYQNVGLAYCQSFIIDEADIIQSENFLACTDCFDRHRWLANYLNDGKNECENFLAGKNTIPNASAVLIRKSIYRTEVDRNNESFKVAGDWFTWSRILLNADVYFVAKSLNYFRSCESSVSRTTSKQLLVIRESLLIFTLFQEQINISPKAQKVFFDLVSGWWISYFVTGNDSPWSKETDLWQQLLDISPNQTSSLDFYRRAWAIPFKRLRYALRLGTRINNWRAKIQH